MNTIYLAKILYDTGRYSIVENSFYDQLDFDLCHENMYCLTDNLFEYSDCRYYEYHNVELHVLSDPVIVKFYELAGIYGERYDIPNDKNPYMNAAHNYVRLQLNFDYCLDWTLMVHTKPQRPYHSRLGVFIYQDDYVDFSDLNYGLINIYEWFKERCEKLQSDIDSCGWELISLSDKSDDIAA